jgi:hypothetical protein
MNAKRQEQIAHRAYEIWQRAGHPQGRHDDHWQQAEAEIDAEAQKAMVNGTGPTHRSGPPTTGAQAQPSPDTAGEAGAPPSGRPGSSKNGSGATKRSGSPKASAGAAATRSRPNS